MNKHPKTEELHQEIVVDASPPEYRQPRWMVQIPVHPVVSVILAVVGSLIVLVTWSVWIIAHHQQFLDTSTILVYAAFISIGLWIAIRLIGQFTRHVIEPAIAAYHEWQIARGQKVKNKVLVTQPHYTVVNELTPDGKYEPKVYPIIQGRLTSPHSDDQALKQLSEPDENATLPTLVRYEDIRHLVPKGHTLLGVGEEQSLETRVFSVLDTCWICGGSKTGKTNTVSLKVEEAYNQGRKFIVIDPHKFKHDSLSNAIGGYSDAFLLPIAQTHEEIVTALSAFLTEAKRRRDGGAYSVDITLVVDEVGSLTGDKGKTPEQKQLFTLLYNIARMCGQELRGFGMSGMFISQNAVGLAWLRAFAMTIIVHKLLMENERKVATNNNMAIVHNMDTWPRGRVLVYGLDIPEGQLLLQQPVFVSRIVDVPAMPELPLFRQSETEETRRNTLRNTDETPLEADGEMKVTPLFRVSEEEQPARLKKEMVSDETKRTIAKMAKDGIPHRKIAGYVHLSGEKYGLFKQVCTELGIETKKAEEA